MCACTAGLDEAAVGNEHRAAVAAARAVAADGDLPSIGLALVGQFEENRGFSSKRKYSSISKGRERNDLPRKGVYEPLVTGHDFALLSLGERYIEAIVDPDAGLRR